MYAVVFIIPKSIGSLERSHKVLVDYLRAFCEKKYDSWSDWIDFAAFTYNTTPHSVTKYTPFELLYGRIANMPGVLQKRVEPLYNYKSYAKQIKYQLQLN